MRKADIESTFELHLSQSEPRGGSEFGGAKRPFCLVYKRSCNCKLNALSINRFMCKCAGERQRERDRESESERASSVDSR